MTKNKTKELFYYLFFGLMVLAKGIGQRRTFLLFSKRSRVSLPWDKADSYEVY